MKENQKRKTDRRTLYTISVIKEALLTLKNTKSFGSITVADICREAEINRGTFYLHYNNIMEVLDDLLDDAFSEVSDLLSHLAMLETGDRKLCSMPMCIFIRESQKYKSILMDDYLHSYIVNRIILLYQDDFLREMEKRTDLSRKQLEAFMRFHMNGCFAVSKWGTCYDHVDWCAAQGFIDELIGTGLKAHYKEISPE